MRKPETREDRITRNNERYEWNRRVNTRQVRRARARRAGRYYTL